MTSRFEIKHSPIVCCDMLMKCYFDAFGMPACTSDLSYFAGICQCQSQNPIRELEHACKTNCKWRHLLLFHGVEDTSTYLRPFRHRNRSVVSATTIAFKREISLLYLMNGNWKYAHVFLDEKFRRKGEVFRGSGVRFS